uniref:Uncharacterized protein n=1 Tax=Ditylenchus dipsaci TaxID=166011 RepID=A0A915DRV1_9BILA
MLWFAVQKGFDDEMLDEKIDCGGVEPEEDEKPEILPSKNVVKMEVASNKPAIRYVSDKAMNLSTQVAVLVLMVSHQPSCLANLLKRSFDGRLPGFHHRSAHSLPSHQTRLIPSLIQLKACLISSTQLLNRSRLAATEGLGYEMASFLWNLRIVV